MEVFKAFTNPKNLIFFSDKGESMSDAHNMKGKCTQIGESVQSVFNSLGPVEETIVFEGNGVFLNKPANMSAEELAPYIGHDAEANALNGWYARAIAAKGLILEDIGGAPVESFLEEGESFQSTAFEEFTLREPVCKRYTEDDAMALWSANELADFLVKEQYCATVGKLIHKSGKLHALYNTPLNQTSRFEKLESGERGSLKAYPVSVNPVYRGADLAKIQELYIKSHNEHREVEKRVNYYKAKCKNELADMISCEQLRYSAAMQEWNREFASYNERRTAFLQGVRTANSALVATCESRRQLLKREASKLKIFIPDVLRKIKKDVETFMA
jgi:hypothetical protein